MGLALTLRQYLDDKHIDYDVLKHKRTLSAEPPLTQATSPAIVSPRVWC